MHAPLELVIDRLKACWSPEQSAGRLAEDAANPVRICPETIYRFVYCKEDYGLGLYRYLPEARRKRRPRGSRRPRNNVFPDLANVTQQQLTELAHHLNSQPRKCLGYRTPAEAFAAYLRESG